MAGLPVIVLGAGVSHDASADFRGDPSRPPLVKHLFTRGEPDDQILRIYRLAEMAREEIHAAGAAGAPDSLEGKLRTQYRDSEHEHDRRIFAQIPLYLQHRLLLASRGAPGYLDRLILAALRLDEVLFVTLNYDLLLDQRLSELSPPALTAVGSYVSKGRKWSLIKLHGSVNWARMLPVSPQPDPRDPLLVRTLTRYALEAPPEGEVVLREVDAEDVHSLASARSAGRKLFYPSISVPLGGGEAVVSCPPGHVEFLTGKLRDADGLHLLFLGYSGHDTDILRLIRESENTFRSVTVVDPDGSAHDRIVRGLGRLPPAGTSWVEAPFSEFILEHLGELLSYFDTD